MDNLEKTTRKQPSSCVAVKHSLVKTELWLPCWNVS